MSKEYQGFAISDFRTGFDESVEPWLLPRDAYQSMINAHLYRGVLEKINGYQIFAKFTDRKTVSLGAVNGIKTTFTGTLSPLPVTSNFFAYGTIIAGTSAETFSYDSDASSTVINLAGTAGGTGTVNISTGAYSITFNTAPPAGTYSEAFISWDYSPSVATAIMGIKPYFGNTGAQEVLVFDQKRLGKIISIFGTLATQAGALQAISEIPHDYYQSAIFTGDGATATFTGTLSGAPFVPGTLVFTEYDSTGLATGTTNAPRFWIDNGIGHLIGAGITTGTVNYVTGAYTITFSVNLPIGNYVDSTIGVYGDLFSGSISDFFSLVNYQYSAFFCNDVDPIFYYDGISIHYLNTSLSVKTITSSGGRPTFFGDHGYDISTCLHVFVNRERLLLMRPIVDAVLAASTIYWSTAGDPYLFTNDELLVADTSQPIRSFGYINTDVVVRFSNSERVFRYTSDAFSPFRWDSTNNIWACDSPYGVINYDSWFSSVGRPGIVGSDGVNVKRVDDRIPDFTDPDRLAQDLPVPFMSQTSIKICYGERFDDIKEGWLCYNSSPTDEGEVTASDNVLAFNYLDSTYAIYQFPFSCLGYGRIINVPTWGTTFATWEDMDVTWGSYSQQSNALIDLGGDQFDKVYELNVGNSLGDGVTPVLMSVFTKNLNPYVEGGELARFGYVDLLVSAYNTSTLRVQFYVNDNLYIDSSGNPAGYYQETTLTFTSTDNMSSNPQTKVWKRIYVGSVGKFHTMRFYQNAADFATTLDQSIYIHAMVWYMKPAGRIFS